MPTLDVYKHGSLIQTLNLVEGEEYFVGRGDDCEAVLDKATGISRRHFKVFHDGDHWQIKLLSKLGHISHLGAKVTQVSLKHSESFSISPFEFIFKDEDSKKSSLPVAQDPKKEKTAPPPPPDPSLTSSAILCSTTDRTTIRKGEEKPYVIIQNTKTQEEETFRLEGDIWTAGRDKDCEIVLKDQGASRRHFELSFSQEGYFVRDLKSANGTKVNGNQILTDQPYAIKSGDVISILSLHIIFQIRDASFKQKLDLVPTEIMAPIEPYPVALERAQTPSFSADPSEKEPVNSPPKSSLKKNVFKIASVAVLAFALWLVFSDSSKNKTKDKKQTQRVVATDRPDIFQNLPEQQRQLINNSYNIAKEQSLRKHCELALPELRRIHEIIPFFKDSKEIESHCANQIELMKQWEEINRRKELKLQTEKRVEEAVSKCEAKISSFSTQEELTSCFGEDAMLIPEHPGIQKLQNLIDEKITEKKRQKQARQEYQKRVSRGTYLYNMASSLEKKGQDYDAVNAYQKFLSASLPDPSNLRPKAERSIASLNQSMSAKVDALVEKSREYFEQSQFNKGMYLLKSGLKINPTSQKIKSAIQSGMQQNDREMKLLYSDSILEESMGNIESAKDRWRKILETSYTGSSYYKKTKLKLRKYGQ